MKVVNLGVFLLLSVCLAFATHNTEDAEILNLNQEEEGQVWPCNVDFWVTQAFNDFEIGQYLEYNITITDTDKWLLDSLDLYIRQGFMPEVPTHEERPESYDLAQLDVSSTATSFVYCGLTRNPIYFAVVGGDSLALPYSLEITRHSVDIVDITDEPRTLFETERDENEDGLIPEFYHHYKFSVPPYVEGQYMVVNISYVETNLTMPTLRVNYDDLALPGCTPFDCRVSNNDGTTECECTPNELEDEDTCTVTVIPCSYRDLQGSDYYFSVELPEATQLNYTISAHLYAPTIKNLTESVEEQDLVAVDEEHKFEKVLESTHYILEITEDMLNADGTSYLEVTISNVVGGTVTVSIDTDHFTGAAACDDPIVTCQTSWHCNLVIPECEFAADTYYLAVDADSVHRDPVRYTIVAEIKETPATVEIVPGQVVTSAIFENEYHFYSMEIPEHTYTYLYAELYTRRNDTEIGLVINQAELNGYLANYDWRTQCFEDDEWDYQCETKDGGEACYYHIPRCELYPGTIYLAVLGLQEGLTHYGKNTYYNVPAEYTLWVDLIEPRHVLNNVSYTEHVYEDHYQHYYIVVETVTPGDHLVVRFENVQNGQITGYVYFEDMAGECPCYNFIEDCTTGEECEIEIDTCIFEPGVWYISAHGDSNDNGERKEIGYTMTPQIHPAPEIWDLELDEIHRTWIHNDESHIYRIDTKARAGRMDNLIVNIVQEHKEWDFHNVISYDVFPSEYHVEEDEDDYYRCYERICDIDDNGDHNYCLQKLPYCEYYNQGEGVFYVHVHATADEGDGAEPTLYTIRAYLETDPVWTLTSGETVYGRIENHGHHHYAINVPSGQVSMIAEIYTNNDQDKISFRMNVDEPAGHWPCLDYLRPYECNTTTSCYWKLEPCELTGSTYYFSVFAEAPISEDERYHNQYYAVTTEYTLTVTFVETATELQFNEPIMALVHEAQMNHYFVDVPPLNPGEEVIIEVGNVRHGSVRTYLAKEDQERGVELAGPCPCYFYDLRQDASDTDNDRITTYVLPYCLHAPGGRYYLGVYGTQGDEDEPRHDDALGWTATGYTISVYYKIPKLEPIDIGDRRADTLEDQQYFHYNLNTETLQEYPQLQIYFDEVEHGSFKVFATKGIPAQDFPGCYLWEAECDTDEADECQLALPDCLFDDDDWWVAVKATTNDILEYNVRFEIEYPTAISLASETNYTSLYGFNDHYRVNNVQVGEGRYLIAEVENVEGVTVEVYINEGALAGTDSTCPYCSSYLPTDGIYFDNGHLCAGDCTYVVPSCILSDSDVYITLVPSSAEVNYTLTVFNPDSDQDVEAFDPFEVIDIELTDEYQWAMYTLQVPVEAASEGTNLEISVVIDAASAPASISITRGNIAGGELCDEVACEHVPGLLATTCSYALGACCTVADTYYVGIQQRDEGEVTGTLFAKYWSVNEEQTMTAPGSTSHLTDGSGITNDNYHFYRFQFSEETLASATSVRFNVTVSDDSDSDLYFYLRPVYLAGDESTSSCYTSWYDGHIPIDSEFYYEIPACNFLPNVDYVASLYNDDAYPNDDEDELNEALYDFEISTYGVKSYTVGEWRNVTINDQLFEHYVFDITEDDISAGRKFLVVEAIEEDGNIAGLFLSYESWHYYQIENNEYATYCGADDNCLDAVLGEAGDSFFRLEFDTCRLSAGTYYATVAFFGSQDSVEYDFRAFFETQDWDLRPGQEVSETQYRFAPVVQVDPEDDEDMETFISINVDPAEIRDHTALIVNVTDVAGGSVTVTLYRGCSSWSCTTEGSFNFPGSCIISSDSNDGHGLGPCDLETGEYRIHVQNFDLANVTATPYLIYPEEVLDLAPTLYGTVWDSDYLYAGFHHVWTVSTPSFEEGWATLDVSIWNTCGELEAWINYEDEAGPACAMDHCVSTGGAKRQDNQIGAGEDWENNCHLSIDTCDVMPNATYYITVRALSQEFTAEHDYLPVHYDIYASMDYYPIFSTVAQCRPTHNYDSDGDDEDELDMWDDYLMQNYLYDFYVYYYDLDTITPGSALYFTGTEGETGHTLYVAHEGWFAGDVDCGGEMKKQCTMSPSCEITYSNCEVQNGRYYIFVTESSTELYIHREQVDTFYPEEETYYTATIGTLGVTGSTKHVQYYKFYVDPESDEFMGTIRFMNVMDGSITVWMGPMENDYTITAGSNEHDDDAIPIYAGWRPDGPGCAMYSCTADENTNCTFKIHPSDCRHYTSDTWFAAVRSASQDEEDVSVTYTLWYELYPEVSSLVLDTPMCDEVQEDNYDHWRLKPEYEEETELVFTVTAAFDEDIRVLITDWENRLATNEQDNDQLSQDEDGEEVVRSHLAMSDDACARAYWDNPSDDTEIIWQCEYSDLHLSVFGVDDDNDKFDEFQIPYFIEVTRRTLNVTEIAVGDVVTEECGGTFYYKFEVTNATEFLDIKFYGGGSLYINYDSFASEYCNIDKCTSSCNLAYFKGCALPNGMYYIKIEATTGFTLNLDNTAWSFTDLTESWVQYETSPYTGLDVQSYDLYKFTLTEEEIYSLVSVTPKAFADQLSISDLDMRVYHRWSGSDDVEILMDGDHCRIESSSKEDDVELAEIDDCELEVGDYYVFVRKTGSNPCLTDYEYPVIYNIMLEKNTGFPDYINITHGERVSGTLNTNTDTGVLYRFEKLRNATDNTPLYVQLYDVDQDVPLMVYYGTAAPISLCREVGCTTQDNDDEDKLHIADLDTELASCDFDLDGCLYNTADEWFFYIRIPDDYLTTACQDEMEINYSFVVTQEAWTPLTSKRSVEVYHGENMEMSYFSIDTKSTKSVTVSLDIEENEYPVEVEVYSDTYCDNDYARLWKKTCEAGEYCDIEIPTWAAHPEYNRNDFYVTVHSNRANYTITMYSGTDNCAKIDFSDKEDAFCDNDIVNYATWTWRDWSSMDEEARCLYDQVWEEFHDEDACIECREAVRRWACVSTFRSCDSSGFITPVCENVCEHVHHYCEYTFDDIEFTEYNCTSHRYANRDEEACSGAHINVIDSDTDGALSGASVILPTVFILLTAVLALFL